MLRVGLTGGLGSGKSTVGALLAEMGARVFSADEIARALMGRGEGVYRAILERFGEGVLLADGSLNRAELARLAFVEGRVEELNAIVHPATIARQEQLVREVFAQDERAIVVVESALIFETAHGDGWRARFDCIVLVTAPTNLKVMRFVARAGAGDRAALEAEAQRRLAKVMPDEEKIALADVVISNEGSLDELQAKVAEVWQNLLARDEQKRMSL